MPQALCVVAPLLTGTDSNNLVRRAHHFTHSHTHTLLEFVADCRDKRIYLDVRGFACLQNRGVHFALDFGSHAALEGFLHGFQGSLVVHSEAGASMRTGACGVQVHATRRVVSLSSPSRNMLYFFSDSRPCDDFGAVKRDVPFQSTGRFVPQPSSYQTELELERSSRYSSPQVALLLVAAAGMRDCHQGTNPRTVSTTCFFLLVFRCPVVTSVVCSDGSCHGSWALWCRALRSLREHCSFVEGGFRPSREDS